MSENSKNRAKEVQTIAAGSAVNQTEGDEFTETRTDLIRWDTAGKKNDLDCFGRILDRYFPDGSKLSYKGRDKESSIDAICDDDELRRRRITPKTLSRKLHFVRVARHICGSGVTEADLIASQTVYFKIGQGLPDKPEEWQSLLIKAVEGHWDPDLELAEAIREIKGVAKRQPSRCEEEPAEHPFIADEIATVDQQADSIVQDNDDMDLDIDSSEAVDVAIQLLATAANKQAESGDHGSEKDLLDAIETVKNTNLATPNQQAPVQDKQKPGLLVAGDGKDKPNRYVLGPDDWTVLKLLQPGTCFDILESRFYYGDCFKLIPETMEKESCQGVITDMPFMPVPASAWEDRPVDPLSRPAFYPTTRKAKNETKQFSRQLLQAIYPVMAPGAPFLTFHDHHAARYLYAAFANFDNLFEPLVDMLMLSNHPQKPAFPDLKSLAIRNGLNPKEFRGLISNDLCYFLKIIGYRKHRSMNLVRNYSRYKTGLLRQIDTHSCGLEQLRAGNNNPGTAFIIPGDSLLAKADEHLLIVNAAELDPVHPTPKPREAANYLYQRFVPAPHSRLLEPFSGSGELAFTAIDLGHQVSAYEISLIHYFNLLLRAASRENPNWDNSCELWLEKEEPETTVPSGFPTEETNMPEDPLEAGSDGLPAVISGAVTAPTAPAPLPSAPAIIEILRRCPIFLKDNNGKSIEADELEKRWRKAQ